MLDWFLANNKYFNLLKNAFSFEPLFQPELLPFSYLKKNINMIMLTPIR